MNVLKFFDGQLNPLMQTDKMISLNITKKYRGFGTVEIHFPITRKDVIQILDEHTFLICCTHQVTAVITGWQLGEDIAIFGRTAEWLLTKRFVTPFTLTATPRELAEYGVKNGAGDFAEVLTSEDTGQEAEYTFDGMTSVYDVVMKAAEASDEGFSLTADTKSKRFVFTLYKGQDKNLLLARTAKNACQIQYTRDLLERATDTGWYMRDLEYMGEWDALHNIPLLSSPSESNLFKYYLVSASGTRFGGKYFSKGQYAYCDSMDGAIKAGDTVPQPNWAYIDNKNVSGAERWDTALDNEIKTPQQATAEIGKSREKISTDTLLRHIEYGKDYDLGDTVRIRAEFGDFRKTVQKTVTEVDIFYDTDGCGCCPRME